MSNKLAQTPLPIPHAFSEEWRDHVRAKLAGIAPPVDVTPATGDSGPRPKFLPEPAEEVPPHESLTERDRWNAGITLVTLAVLAALAAVLLFV